MSALQWCEPSRKGEPAQWYLRERPCEITRLGVLDGKVAVIEVRAEDGLIVAVRCIEGEYPGLQYETLPARRKLS
jgi:hypothetical protein